MSAWSVLARMRRRRPGRPGPRPRSNSRSPARDWTVVVALGGGLAEDLDLAGVETEAAVDRLRSAVPGRADWEGTSASWQLSTITGAMALASMSVERLGGEDDRGVLLAQGLEPLAQLASERRVVEGQPALVDQDQGRPAVELPLDAVKEIGSTAPAAPDAEQAFGLERLNRGGARCLMLGVEQPTPRSLQGKGREGVLQVQGRQQGRQARQAAFGRPAPRPGSPGPTRCGP
jgi:hypothetical protein